ncbi:MAG: hypothetical protein CMD87_00010 [Gammaproteobacteria bacterium]|nr:hypothetical protein [Gammaproteobacteria bacterium]
MGIVYHQTVPRIGRSETNPHLAVFIDNLELPGLNRIFIGLWLCGNKKHGHRHHHHPGQSQRESFAFAFQMPDSLFIGHCVFFCFEFA